MERPLPPAAAPARPLVVTLTGPESTGKTTLAEWLARRFDVPWSAEHARAYVDGRLAAGDRTPLAAADVAPIARGQLRGEDAAAEEARAAGRPLVVRDTDLVSTVVYARRAFGAAPAWVVDAARTRRAALYLLCDVDAPWVPDPVRDADPGARQARAALRDAFAATLDALGCRWVPLRGSWEERARAADAHVAALLRG